MVDYLYDCLDTSLYTYFYRVQAQIEEKKLLQRNYFASHNIF